MKGLLVRVAVDQSSGGGNWNSPVNSNTGEFVYVSIPEHYPSHKRLLTPYSRLVPRLKEFGTELPQHLATVNMHLDPDFDYLTYGDQGERATQISKKLDSGDLLVFYAGLSDVNPAKRLVYAIIGLYVVEKIVSAVSVPVDRRNENAHSRRILDSNVKDIIVRAKEHVSGRLQRCISIGSYRDRAYRVRPEIEDEWGGLSNKNGYLQRSARLPEFKDAEKFYNWFLNHDIPLLRQNNL